MTEIGIHLFEVFTDVLWLLHPFSQVFDVEVECQGERDGQRQYLRPEQETDMKETGVRKGSKKRDEKVDREKGLTGSLR
ncbi:hypothetical protein [Haloplanus natans]|uniref:hypothetical protein n=1 Tax=Haloplanus natans TaxID=376171 RepID=UPI0012F77B90|nr:hypothetical protein [Haloplanus natans]